MAATAQRERQFPTWDAFLFASIHDQCEEALKCVDRSKPTFLATLKESGKREGYGWRTMASGNRMLDRDEKAKDA